MTTVNEQVVEAELPVTPGRGRASWYQWDGTYVVLFLAPALTDAPLCPGTSFLADVTQGFDYVTNSPADARACDDYPFPSEQLIERPFGARRCGPLLLYYTPIPVTEAGQLWASIEQYRGDIIRGVTGAATAESATPPELDPAGSSYRFIDRTQLEGVAPAGTSIVLC